MPTTSGRNTDHVSVHEGYSALCHQEEISKRWLGQTLTSQRMLIGTTGEGFQDKVVVKSLLSYGTKPFCNLLRIDLRNKVVELRT